MSKSAAGRLLREERDVRQQTVPTVFAQPEECDIHHWRAAASAPAVGAKHAYQTRRVQQPVGARNALGGGRR